MGLRDKLATTVTRGAESIRGAAERSNISTGAPQDWLQRALAAIPQPAAPVTQRWEASVGALVASQTSLPGPAARALHSLDTIGAVVVSPTEVGFDGTTIPWSDVVEVRLHSAVDLLPDVVIDKEVDRIRRLFPPVPGRKWLVHKTVDGLLTLALTAFNRPASEARAVPCEIVYRGSLGRTKQLSGGLFVAGALAELDGVSEAVVATAQAHRIPVTPVHGNGSESRAQHAQHLQARAGALRDRLSKKAEGTDEGKS
ncbi:hypothetical protein [Antrihabitans spumae]|uniref:Uncharacterized protein n=1 Tax=Antrihabitans spumae TaxID=3373370 RepID=A0ABW7KFF9_9NOCA